MRGLHGGRNQLVANYPSKSAPFLEKTNGMTVLAEKIWNAENGTTQLKTIL